MNRWIVGVDEVGRGPLAGPVTVGAVATTRPYEFHGVRDSKRLSPNQRQAWYYQITKNPEIKWAIASVGQGGIDRVGITKALYRAVSRALLGLYVMPSLVLLDGSLYAPPEFRQCTIIKGDEQIPLIAAASIIAKVTRDRFMERQHVRFPEYGFAAHKGYGTRAHYQALRRYGSCVLHRQTFL